jgi:hypothetical protein
VAIPVAKSFFLSPLTLALSPRWGERGQEEKTFGKRYKSTLRPSFRSR